MPAAACPCGCAGHPAPAATSGWREAPGSKQSTRDRRIDVDRERPVDREAVRSVVPGGAIRNVHGPGVSIACPLGSARVDLTCPGARRLPGPRARRWRVPCRVAAVPVSVGPAGDRLDSRAVAGAVTCGRYIERCPAAAARRCEPAPPATRFPASGQGARSPEAPARKPPAALVCRSRTGWKRVDREPCSGITRRNTGIYSHGGRDL